MSKSQPLWHRLAFRDVYKNVARRVHYTGFPVCQLAEKFRDLVAKYGAKELAEVYYEILSFERNRVMLNPAARKGCWQLLGPPPEKKLEFWANVNMDKRPEGWDHVPEETPPQIDPVTDGLRALTATELDMKLRQSWAVLRKQNSPKHQRELAAETIPRVESEMIRRGQDIPQDIEKPEDKPQERPAGEATAEKPKKPRKRK